jgi:hypothetical protein
LKKILDTYKNNYELIDSFNTEIKKVIDKKYFKQNADIDKFITHN